IHDFAWRFGAVSGPSDARRCAIQGEANMTAKAVFQLPGEASKVTLSGHLLTSLVTGEDTRHASMFDWTIPAGFSTGLHVHRVQEETFYVLEGECVWHVGDRTIYSTPRTYLS